MIFEQIMNAVLLGCTYTLVAIGFSLFFGVLDVVVFCAGDIAIFGSFGVIGSYLVISQTSLVNLPLPILGGICLAISAILCSAFALFAYFISIRPFEKSSALMPLLSTIALGMALREAIGLFFPKGRNPQGFPQLIYDQSIGGITYSSLSILIITIIVLVLLFFFLNKTKMGLSMQAISQNKELAYMTGINIRRTIMITFILGGALLSVGGFLIGSYYGVIRFSDGAMYGIKGFSAAVVGGLRSIYGAVIGGMLIGFVEVFVSASSLPGAAAFSNVIAFIVVVLFIVFKPEGIIGDKSIEKV